MAAEIVFANYGLKLRLQSLWDSMQANHSLRLYTNSARPDPSWTIKQFTEAGFNGYARVNLAGKLLPIFKVVDGSWEFRSQEITFSAIAGSDEWVYGWYVVFAGDVICSARLPVRVHMLPGQALTVRLAIDATSTSLLKPL